MKKVLIYLVAILCVLSISYQPVTGSISDMCAAIPEFFYYLTILWNGAHPDDEPVTPFVLFVSYCFSAVLTVFLFTLVFIGGIFISITEAATSLVKAPFVIPYTMFKRCCTVPQPPYDL